MCLFLGNYFVNLKIAAGEAVQKEGVRLQHLASEIDLNFFKNRFGVHKIVRLTYYNEQPDWIQMLHKHDDHCEIIYIESGTG